MSDTRATTQSVRYRERLWVPWWWWLPGLGLAALISVEVNMGIRSLPDWVPYAVLLPVAVVVLYDMGYVVSMVRASMVEVMQRPYIRTAVLKGLASRRVVVRHALRNAMITPATIIFLQLGYLIAGLVVVETVFAYPGFGRMMLEAALYKDIAVLEVGALVAVFVTVMTQVLADLAYMVLDPRIHT